jgi:hypothetical protein
VPAHVAGRATLPFLAGPIDFQCHQHDSNSNRDCLNRSLPPPIWPQWRGNC